MKVNGKDYPIYYGKKNVPNHQLEYFTSSDDSDILPDISCGIFYGISILTFYIACSMHILRQFVFLTTFLTFYLASIPGFYLASIPTFFLAHILTFFPASYLASTPTFYRAFFLTVFLACILTIFLASILTFYLAFFWHLFIFITMFFLSKFRFRFIIHSIPPPVHSGDEPAQRTGWRQKEGRKKGGKEEVAPLIESRNPYLAGREQTAKMGFHQQKFCCTAT